MSLAEPIVSLGLPVYNGENYLLDALESILAQSYQDFELIICDNASTDATEQICRQFAEKDQRIRYQRNAKNIGACPNFNRTVELAKGAYFKWAAHDDLLAPDYLEKCVAVLDKNPDVVLCYTQTRVIDAQGEELAIYDSGLNETESDSVTKRFAPMVLVYHLCTETFGLIRTESLRQTQLLADYHGCDRTLLAELVLLGRFSKISEPLFSNREHGARYSRAVVAQKRANWHDAKAKQRIGLYTWRVYTDYIRMVQRHVKGMRQRSGCYRHLVHWWLVNWNSLRILSDVVTAVCPGAFQWAERVKNKLVTPPHPLSTKG